MSYPQVIHKMWITEYLFWDMWKKMRRLSTTFSAHFVNPKNVQFFLDFRGLYEYNCNDVLAYISNYVPIYKIISRLVMDKGGAGI